MKKATKAALAEVLELIERVTDSKQMSQREYLEFCEELECDVDSRLECVRSELGEDS